MLGKISIDTQQKQNICMTVVQRRPNVFDVGPTLHICYTNVLCLLGSVRPTSNYHPPTLRKEKHKDLYAV